MKAIKLIFVLSLFYSLGLEAQQNYVGVWEKGSGSNLITKPTSWKAFLQKGEEMTQDGLRLDDFEIIRTGPRVRYVGNWRSGTGSNIITKGLIWKDFLKKGGELTKKGFRLWDFETFIRGGKRLYVGNWRSGTGSNIIIEGLLWKDFLKKGEELTKKGFRLWDFEIIRKNNANYYISNWRSGTGSNIVTKGLPWTAFLKKGEELTEKGFRLYDVEIIKTGTTKKYVGAWRSGTGSNIITKGIPWEDFSKKGEELTKKGMRLTDFELFSTPVRTNPESNPNPGSVPGTPDFPKTPSYVKLLDGTIGSDKYRVVVDFTKIVDGKPEITIPTQFLTTLPSYEGDVIFPNNFCGLRIIKVSRFVWLDTGGNIHDEFPYNNVPENSSLKNFFENDGQTLYLGGIDFTGPIGKCENGSDNWVFPYPYTQTQTVFSQPLKLVIELDPDSSIEFLNFKINPGKPLDADKFFKEVDFKKIIKFYEKTFYDGFKQWIDVVCEKNPEECPLQN